MHQRSKSLELGAAIKFLFLVQYIALATTLDGPGLGLGLMGSRSRRGVRHEEKPQPQLVESVGVPLPSLLLLLGGGMKVVMSTPNQGLASGTASGSPRPPPPTHLLMTALSPEPPVIAPGPSNMTLTAHSPASLPCEASGSPRPLVAWWKDGQKLDLHLQQGAYR